MSQDIAYRSPTLNCFKSTSSQNRHCAFLSLALERPDIEFVPNYWTKYRIIIESHCVSRCTVIMNFPNVGVFDEITCKFNFSLNPSIWTLMSWRFEGNACRKLWFIEFSILIWLINSFDNYICFRSLLFLIFFPFNTLEIYQILLYIWRIKYLFS